MNDSLSPLDVRRIEELASEFPLPARTSPPQYFVEVADCFGVPIHLAGVALDVSGECVTGSAAQFDEAPLLRAHMELVERVVVFQAMEKHDEPIALKDFQGRPIAHASAEHVFPASPDPLKWRWARSNGVAVGRSWTDAAARARWELSERDTILRSFYGEAHPRYVATLETIVPSGLLPHFLFCSYAFERTAIGGYPVAAVFGFPHKEDAPLVFGFGSRDTFDGALRVALSECIQRLGFLAGEALPTAEPEPSASPDFHQDFYLYPPHRARLTSWLRGEHAAHDGCLRAPSPVAEEIVFADLTPPSLAGKLFVAKALPNGHVPLAFGVGHPMLVEGFPTELSVHPIA